MYPELYSNNGSRLAVLDNIVAESASHKRVLGGEFTFKFDAVEAALKSEYFDSTNRVEILDQAFDIKSVRSKHNKDLRYTIQTEHVSYRLGDGESNTFASFAGTGTPTLIMTELLAGTGFSVGIVDFTNSITISINEACTRKTILQSLAAELGGELDFTDKGFTINLVSRVGQDNGYQVRFGKNLVGITKTIDIREEIDTWYSVDIVKLGTSKGMLGTIFEELDKLEIGDNIRVIDSVINLDVEDRVFALTQNPITNKIISVDIGNVNRSIVDKITQIDTDAVKKNTVYNTCSISTDYGFRTTASDESARGTFSYGEIKMEVKEGGSWVPVLYLNPLTGKYEFVGNIDATGYIRGAEIIGGSIYIGGGVFEVDNDGKVTCTDIQILGGVFNINDNFIVGTDGRMIAKSAQLTSSKVDDVLTIGDALEFDESYIKIERKTASASIGWYKASSMVGSIYLADGTDLNMRITATLGGIKLTAAVEDITLRTDGHGRKVRIDTSYLEIVADNFTLDTSGNVEFMGNTTFGTAPKVGYLPLATLAEVTTADNAVISFITAKGYTPHTDAGGYKLNLLTSDAYGITIQQLYSSGEPTGKKIDIPWD